MSGYDIELGGIKVGVIGAGGWGTALAITLCQNFQSVKIWSFEECVADEINSKHTNSEFLPGITLPEAISASHDLNNFSEMDILVLTIPTQFVRSVLAENKDLLADKYIVNCAKGVERGTMLRISEILYDFAGISPEKYSILTGPSHAEEVARKMPTTVTVASDNFYLAGLVQKIFNTEKFRVYTSDDVIGCEIGSALKNVIAIAAGVIDGLGLGDNTKAALITRGLAEMSRLGVALGANPMTFSGLSGLGDLYVTCSSRHSRNRRVGELIGNGKTLDEIVSDMKMVAEGVATTESAYGLGKKHLVEIPITEQMHKILFENACPMTAIRELMTRQTKREWWW